MFHDPDFSSLSRGYIQMSKICSEMRSFISWSCPNFIDVQFYGSFLLFFWLLGFMTNQLLKLRIKVLILSEELSSSCQQPPMWTKLFIGWSLVIFIIDVSLRNGEFGHRANKLRKTRIFIMYANIVSRTFSS